MCNSSDKKDAQIGAAVRRYESAKKEWDAVTREAQDMEEELAKLGKLDIRPVGWRRLKVDLEKQVLTIADTRKTQYSGTETEVCNVSYPSLEDINELWARHSSAEKELQDSRGELIRLDITVK